MTLVTRPVETVPGCVGCLVSSHAGAKWVPQLTFHFRPRKCARGDGYNQLLPKRREANDDGSAQGQVRTEEQCQSRWYGVIVRVRECRGGEGEKGEEWELHRVTRRMEKPV